MRVVRSIAGVIVVAHALGALANRMLLPRERRRVHPYGRLVDVDGRKLQVVALGGGDATIVLLAGANLPCRARTSGR